MSLVSQVQYLNDGKLELTTLVKSIDSSLSPFPDLVRQPVKEKENFEFKSVLLRFEIDFESHLDHGVRLG